MYEYRSCIYIFKSLFQNHDPMLHRKLFAQCENHAYNTQRKLILSRCNWSKTQSSTFYFGVKFFSEMSATFYPNAFFNDSKKEIRN